MTTRELLLTPYFYGARSWFPKGFFPSEVTHSFHLLQLLHLLRMRKLHCLPFRAQSLWVFVEENCL